MKTKTELVHVARTALCRIGIEAGMDVLDFGCGEGDYTVAAADLVRPGGTVTAIDKNQEALHRLRERLGRDASTHVRIQQAVGSCDIDLPDSSMDFILLFDVLHDHYFSTDQRRDLFDEVARVGRPAMTLSIFPHHIDSVTIAEDIVPALEQRGFRASETYQGPLLHDHQRIEDELVTFRKQT